MTTGEKYKQTFIFFSEIYIRPKKKICVSTNYQQKYIYTYNVGIKKQGSDWKSGCPKIAIKTLGYALKLGPIGWAETHGYFGLK